jgi:ribosomal protein S27AE
MPKITEEPVMANLFNLQCPTCGASLQADGSSKQVACGHCGNQYLLEKTPAQMDESQRENLSPSATYASRPGQWFKVADVDVLLHSLSEETIGREHVLFAEVEYLNKTPGPMKYRHDQWIVFDKYGYTYEATMDYLHPKLYKGKVYIGRTRMLNPGMRLRGWLVFILPFEGKMECLQFSAGSQPIKTLEFCL